MNFVSLRAAETAQREIRHYADAVEQFFAQKMPVTPRRRSSRRNASRPSSRQLQNDLVRLEVVRGVCRTITQPFLSNCSSAYAADIRTDVAPETLIVPHETSGRPSFVR
jgi:hypothetical protein